MFDFDKAPTKHHGDVFRKYLDYGDTPDPFILAILENNLIEACKHAKDEERPLIWKYVGWMINEAPISAWGSHEKVRKWMDRKDRERSLGMLPK